MASQLLYTEPVAIRALLFRGQHVHLRYVH